MNPLLIFNLFSGFFSCSLSNITKRVFVQLTLAPPEIQKSIKSI